MVRKLALLPILLILAACSTLGVPAPQTFNERAAAATVTANSASRTSLTLLRAHKISPDESDRFIDRAEEAQSVIDTARAIYAMNPGEAENRLSTTIAVLQVLVTELEARK